MRNEPSSLQYEAESRSTVIADSSSESRFLIHEFWELTKPRLSLLSVITAIVGYLAALPQGASTTLVSLVFGTCLAAGGAAVLNQWMEWEADARMVRTRQRPIPAGEITPEAALLYGLILCVAGSLILWTCVNRVSALLAIFTQVSYLLAYTPLKKRTPWCTQIGAIPGAMPPLIGWAAAEGNISTLGWILFAILLFWQIPHFMAIAWTFREDYATAGFTIFSVVDPSGKRISRQSFICTLLLIACSLLPAAFGYTSIFYMLVAVPAGAWILYHAGFFLLAGKRDKFARSLFFVSIAYLPILLGALVVDRMLFI